MTTQKEFEVRMNGAQTAAEVMEILKSHSPYIENCFSCGQRFRGKCPVMKAGAYDIETYCMSDVSAMVLVAAICSIGCMTYEQ